jgi:hypothetical protein
LQGKASGLKAVGQGRGFFDAEFNFCFDGHGEQTDYRLQGSASS